MRIASFHIENFRNLQLAECESVPDFLVLCGGNGCGKTALLEALMTAKEHSGSYGYFPFDPNAVSANAESATIMVTIEANDDEVAFMSQVFKINCPQKDEIVVDIGKGGSAQVRKCSQAMRQLLAYYSRHAGSPGFFDYINAHRRIPKSQLANWDPNFLSDQYPKQTLAGGDQKFQFTKQYLAGLQMRDLQDLQKSRRTGKRARFKDSLQPIRHFFDAFFAPMKFKDVLIDTAPFKFIVSTPQGDIDIDDLSSGEKEIFNTLVRFHQLAPKNAVILFDEADAHLHPDLGRRYLCELRNLAKGNQMLLTTHSPEMMIAAGTESLYTVLKQPPQTGSNQLVRVTADEALHDVLSELMGSRGLVSLNQRIVFIEGEDASADRAIYEAMYPPATHHVSFVPAGNSATVRKTAQRVNALLTTATGFQQYYSIIDRDVDRIESDPTEGRRLFRLPMYHAENLLLDEEHLLAVTRSMLGPKCPYRTAEEVTSILKNLVLSESHLRPYTAALADASLAKLAKDAYDAVYRSKTPPPLQPIPDYSQLEQEAKQSLEFALADDTWRYKCKGRDLLKAYCGKHGFKYEHFRNALIDRIKTPPKALADIMSQILQT